MEKEVTEAEYEELRKASIEARTKHELAKREVSRSGERVMLAQIELDRIKREHEKLERIAMDARKRHNAAEAVAKEGREKFYEAAKIMKRRQRT
jgi:hypothetical protein